MKAVAGIAAFVLTASTAGIACTPIRGYRVPTNFELIEQADLVVLAKVASEHRVEVGTTGRVESSVVFLEPLKALKGAAPARLTVIGYLQGQPNPTNLDKPHPSVFWGGCIRAAYSRGALVIAMFSKQGDEYRQIGAPFARVVEDVEGPNSVWARAAELYVRVVSENPPSGRRKALKLARKRLLLEDTDGDARAIAADISAYFKVVR